MCALSVLPSSPVHHACAPQAPFSCSVSSEGGGPNELWVHAVGELDIATTPELQRVLADACARAPLVVLDLRKLTFLDSTGVHAITDATTDARSRGRRLVTLCGAQTERTLTLTARADQIDTHAGTLSRAAAGPPKLTTASHRF
jgi:anti-sigma B factor antagonist